MCDVTKIEFNDIQNEAVNRFVDRYADLLIEVFEPYFESGEIDPEWLMSEEVIDETRNRFYAAMDKRFEEIYGEIES